jgi:hypothetical protein
MAKIKHTLDSLRGEMSEVFDQLGANVPHMVVAVVATAYLEKTLMAMLRAMLILDPAGPKGDLDVEKLCLPRSGDFGRAASTCYSLGLVSPNTYAELDHIRLIRNEFAHGHLPKTFDTPGIAEHVDGLGVLRLAPMPYKLDRRSEFATAAVLVAQKLHLAALAIKPIERPREWSLGGVITVPEESPSKPAQ